MTCKRVYIFSVICLVSSSCSVEEEWNLFKQNFNREYDNEFEELRYFNNFQNNYEEITRHNLLFDKGKVTYKKGITKFADLKASEFIQIYGLPEGPIKVYNTSYENKNTNKNESDYLDWREKGAVTRVKDQGTCGSCWIFSAVGVLEGYYYRKTKKLVALSEQNMVDCIRNNTCFGGWSPTVFEFLQRHDKGINKEEDYPYKGISSVCRYDKSNRVKVDFEGYRYIENTEDAIKEALIKHGPILVMIGAHKRWQLYKSGVWYENECSERVNHSILLVGYGSENGHDYWLLKNSWGKDWGENGFIKYARNKHQNYCGFTEYAYHLI